MQPNGLENYYFLRMCSIDLDTALNTIKVLRRYKRLDVKYALLRDLTVTYARPFSTNIGRLGKHNLSVKKHVPKHFKPLHNELVRLRMEQFAHTDMTFYNPRVIKFGPQLFAMTFKAGGYEALLGKLPEIEELVWLVEGSVNAQISEYEARPDIFSDAILLTDPVGLAKI